MEISSGSGTSESGVATTGSTRSSVGSMRVHVTAVEPSSVPGGLDTAVSGSTVVVVESVDPPSAATTSSSSPPHPAARTAMTSRGNRTRVS
jgi:hypothetical protein